MAFTRRHWLGWVTAAGLKAAAVRDIGRLLEDPPGWLIPDLRARRYVARATVTLLGVPVFSRSGVGEGYARYQESPIAEGRSIEIEFGAGSFPEKAHGVNKMGFLREAVIETCAGALAECNYFGFMTASQEKSLDDARKSFLPAAENLTYSASFGTIRRDGVSGRTMRIQLPSRYDWRDCAAIAREVRPAVEARPTEEPAPLQPGGDIPATFLYAVRKAILDPRRFSEEQLIFNGKYFVLRTERQPDVAVGRELAARNLARSADRVIRLTGTLQLKHGGNQTNFHVWFESGSEQEPPLRFDYQAKSFLHLSFLSSGPYRPTGVLNNLCHKKENS
jgi:hypothetical protein